MTRQCEEDVVERRTPQSDVIDADAGIVEPTDRLNDHSAAAPDTDPDHPVDCDVLICGDSTEAKAIVSELAETIPGVRAIDAGPLDNARLLENAAALLADMILKIGPDTDFVPR